MIHYEDLQELHNDFRNMADVAIANQLDCRSDKTADPQMLAERILEIQTYCIRCLQRLIPKDDFNLVSDCIL